MATHPAFLSVVLVVRNQAAELPALLAAVARPLAALVADHEIIVVDNASQDDSIATLKRLTGMDGLPDLQVYALIKEVDADTGSWVGLENALGDFVVVVDPLVDDLDELPRMLEAAVDGADVVFARNEAARRTGLLRRGAYALFDRLYRSLDGIELARDAPHFRVLSRRVVNFILQHPQPAVAYRTLPATGGFARVNLTYSRAPRVNRERPLGESIDLGMRLIVTTTRAPMRLVTSLSLFGAAANLLYSVYVVAIWLFKPDVAPGWVSLSLQQSGMFFLISLVLLVLGEYILNMARMSNEGPPYHVGQEFTSARLTRRERLNVEAIAAGSGAGAHGHAEAEMPANAVHDEDRVA